MADFEPDSVEYHVSAVDGGTYEIQDRITGLTWSEGSNEYCTTISFTAINQPTDDSVPYGTTGHFMHEFLKLGMLIVISAKSNVKDEEVARGFILDWKTQSSGNEQSISVKCYDQLYALKKSQVDLFFPKGTDTKTIYDAVLNECGVTPGEYHGPTVAQDKTTLRNKGAQQAIQDIFDYARKQGSERCFLTDRKGLACVYPYGYNKTDYEIRPQHTVQVTNERSILDMITKVKIIGQSDKEGRAPVISVKTGDTRYGIRQKIITQSKDDKEHKAQKEAEETMKDEGHMKELFTLKCPDIPYIHKGDEIGVIVSTLRDRFYVVGISHDADSHTMQLDMRLPRNFSD